MGEKTLRTRIAWDDDDLNASFLALGHVESVTVDPHKLGYVPYPAGVVAFRDQQVGEAVAHRASYIAEWSGPAPSADSRVNAMGAFILEGSKPGAAAAACWLAHKSLPLRADGHGQIVKSTLLSARRLAWILDRHQELYFEFEKEHKRKRQKAFTFLVLGSVDTNIVCFVARPLHRRDGAVVEPVDDGSLAKLNAFNRRIYDSLGRFPRAGTASSGTPHAHPYFVSRTVLEAEEYDPESMAPHLERLHVTREDYETHGLFVLRSTVMNPHYPAAREQGKDYLLDFVGYLHQVARDHVPLWP